MMMTQIRLAMGIDPDRVFEGKLIAEDSTETVETLRWAEFRLYRTTDGTGRYALHMVGRSVVYHVLDNNCGAHGVRRGRPIRVADVTAPEHLGPAAEPCERCNVPYLEELSADAVVDCETNRYTLTVCESPLEVAQALRMSDKVIETRRRKGLPPMVYSEPAQRLLKAAKENDPEFAAAFQTAQQL